MEGEPVGYLGATDYNLKEKTGFFITKNNKDGPFNTRFNAWENDPEVWFTFPYWIVEKRMSLTKHQVLQ